MPETAYCLLVNIRAHTRVKACIIYELWKFSFIVDLSIVRPVGYAAVVDWVVDTLHTV